jgi:sucrose-6-phosphate hydrolase SacC (GH32 family)
MIRFPFATVFSFFILSNINSQDGIQLQEYQTFPSYNDTGYDQDLRSQFHFSSIKGWNNDPNGMVFYNDEYHLYFQHNPKGVNWGNMTWGHAVSKDMVHWKQLNHAILPYRNGTIFSGTAIVDHNNSLGKNTDSKKAIVAFFTHANNSWGDKNRPKQQPSWFYQSAAYSLDDGRTFNLINEGHGVIPNQGFDQGERDPKIFWHEETQKWISILWIKRGDDTFLGPNTGPGDPKKMGKVRFFESSDLINWRKLSDFDRNWVFECMDFVQLPVDGDNSNKKWLLYDASFDYEIGDFNGKEFVTDKNVGIGDYGDNFYAGQTFNNSPDERTIIIGWMPTRDNDIFIENKMPWNQQMSFPSTMELRTTENGIKLFRNPIKEIENLYIKKYSYNSKSINFVNRSLARISPELIDLRLNFKPIENDEFKINIRGQEIIYKNQNFIFQDTNVPAKQRNGKTSIRVLLDRSSIEIYVNEGENIMTTYAVSNKKNKNVSISSNRNMRINLELNELKSSWE